MVARVMAFDPSLFIPFVSLFFLQASDEQQREYNCCRRKWVDKTNSKNSQSAINEEFKELPDGGWRAWFVVSSTFLVSLYVGRL